jgi:mono/diheme cytochrome c family protein
LKRILSVIAAGIAATLLGSCETGSSPAPRITPGMIPAGAMRSAAAIQLTQGRSLFLTRCVACHALPAIGDHPTQEWPRIVNEMAGRSELKRTERDAVLAYILAVRGR